MRAPLPARVTLATSWEDLAAALLLAAGYARSSPAGDLWLDPETRRIESTHRALDRARRLAASRPLLEGFGRALTAHEAAQARAAGWVEEQGGRWSRDAELPVSLVTAAALARADALREERHGDVADEGPRVVREGYDQREGDEGDDACAPQQTVHGHEVAREARGGAR